MSSKEYFRAYHQAHKEDRNQRRSERWYETKGLRSKETIKNRVEQQRQWKLKYPEKVAAGAHRRYIKNKDHIIAKAKEWRGENPEKARQYSAAQRKKNPVKAREAVKNIHRRYRSEMADPYIKHLLNHRGIADTTEPIKNMARGALLVRRFITQLKKEIQNGDIN